MVLFFGGASARAAVVKRTCPHCRTSQTRERKPKDGRYRCNHYHKLFLAGEAAKAASAGPRRKK